MNIEILTPEETLFSGETKLVKVPGKSGSFELLNKHAAIVSTLEKGEIKVIDTDNKEHIINILSGVVECNNNKVTILAEK